MAQIISKNYLEKKLTGDALNAKVGGIRVEGKNLRGAELKKFIKTNLGGKTPTLIEKALKEKYGVSGSQIKKRQSLMELIRCDEKTGLTQEQIQKNLRLTKQIDQPAVGGVKGERGSMERLGVKRGNIGFAKDFAKANKLSNNQASPKPSVGAPPSIKLAA